MSTVIKAGHTGPLLRTLSTVDLADHLAEADAVVAGAKRTAARIAREAGAEADRALQQATSRGYELGYEKGSVEGEAAGHKAAFEESVTRFTKEQGHVVAVMQSAVEEIDRMKDDLDIVARRDVLEFAVQIATRLTLDIGVRHRESAQANLRRALELVATKTELTIRVHPTDMDSIKRFASEVLDRVELSQAVHFVHDESMAPGGCKVATELTEVDATLKTQIEQMVAVLLGESEPDA